MPLLTQRAQTSTLKTRTWAPRPYVITAGLTLAAMCVPVTGALANATMTAPPITINGSALPVSGLERNNVVFIPSDTFKKIGTSVSAKDQSLMASKGGSPLARMTLGSVNADVKGTAQKLGAAPFIANGKVMVPLRVVSEAAGAAVSYSANPRSITVSGATPGAAVVKAAPAAAAAGAVAATGAAATGAVADTSAATAAAVNQGGIPWWVWLLAALIVLGIIFALMRRKKEPLIVTTGTVHSAEPVIKTRS